MFPACFQVRMHGAFIGEIFKFSCLWLHPRPVKSDSPDMVPVDSIFKNSPVDLTCSFRGPHQPPSSGLRPQGGAWGVSCPGFVPLSLASLVAASVSTNKVEPRNR